MSKRMNGYNTFQSVKIRRRHLRALLPILFLTLLILPLNAMAAEFEAFDLASLKNALKAASAVSEAQSTITLSSTVQVKGSLSLSGGKKQITIKRAEGFLSDLFYVQKGASLTLADIAVDGNADQVKNAAGALIHNAGRLTIKAGAELHGNRRVDQGKGGNANGGAVVNLGTLDMRGGVIRDNQAQTGGGGVFNFGGRVKLSGGALIKGNKARLGGGVANADGGRFTMSGQARIEGNTGYQGGGLINSGENARAQIGGDAVLTKNTADFGAGVMNTSALALTGRAQIGVDASDNGLYMGLSQGAAGAASASASGGLSKGARINLEGGVDHDGDGRIPLLVKARRGEEAYFHLTGSGYTLERAKGGPLSLCQYALSLEALDGGDMACIAEGPLKTFLSITLSGALRLDRDYTLASEGSGTRLTLKAKYLSALPAGEYFIRLVFEDGKAEAVFRHDGA